MIFAVDTSQSMMARDVAPDRLTAAKKAVSALIARMDGDRVGLVAFAGDAFLYCPLTIDYGAAQMFLDAMDTSVVGDPGTGIAAAIEVASEGFAAAEHTYRHLVILSDGEDHEGGAIEAARKAHATGLTVHVVGVGGSAGEPIPVLDAEGRITGHKRDARGEVILSRMNEKVLREVAEAGGGVYVSTSGGPSRWNASSPKPGRLLGAYQFTGTGASGATGTRHRPAHHRGRLGDVKGALMRTRVAVILALAVSLPAVVGFIWPGTVEYLATRGTGPGRPETLRLPRITSRGRARRSGQ